MKVVSVVVLLLVFASAASSHVLGADVRNSNWGDTPEVVRRNQEEVNEEKSIDPRVTTLSGATVIDGLPLNVTYTFFDNALVQVSLIASFNRASPGQSNRQANWNPFHDARTLSVLLRTKYGAEVDRQFSLNWKKIGALDAQDWASRMPREAFQEQAWSAGMTTIELFANTAINSNVDYRACSVTYKGKGPRSDAFDAYQAALRDKAMKQRQGDAIKGL